MVFWRLRFALSLLLALPSGAACAAADEVAAPPPDSGMSQPPVAVPSPSYVAVPQPSEQALRYYYGNNLIWCLRMAGALAIPALLLVTGFTARLRDVAHRIGRRGYPTFCVYVALYLLLHAAAVLPFSYCVDFVRQHEYDLSNQTAGKWLSDLLKGGVVTFVAACAVGWIPLAVIRRSPRWWWFWLGLLAGPFMAFVVLITPIWIQPLFNEFGPMRDKPLEARILALASRAGIDGSRVFEVNKSVDTKAVNAYVVGLAGTKRIVLWDTLVDKLDDDEVLFVMGHEMGHYVLGHVVRTLGVIWGLAFAALLVTAHAARWLAERFARRFRFDALHDVAAIPLLLLVGQAVSLALSPLALAYSRYNEREADRFALELLQSNRAAATGFVKLQQENLGNPRPGPLYMFWRATHPNIAQRIEFFNTYRPWEEGQPLRYGHLFDRRHDSPPPVPPPPRMPPQHAGPP
jgi:Zn-dependent protease with chaperone function